MFEEGDEVVTVLPHEMPNDLPIYDPSSEMSADENKLRDEIMRGYAADGRPYVLYLPHDWEDKMHGTPA